MSDQNNNIFFPDMQNKHILMDDVAKYSITLPEKADMITEIIRKNYQLMFPTDNLEELYQNLDNYNIIILNKKIYLCAYNLTKIYSKCLDDLNVAYSILIVEYIKKELVKKEGNSGDGKNKGVVIDVTEE
jgi:hypothetical protein